MASAGPSNTTSSIIEIRPPSPAVPRSSRGGEPIQQQATSPPASRRQGRIAVPDKDVIERLGRQRPAIFGSTISELGFCFSLLASAFLAEFFISGFSTILPAIHESDSLHMPKGSGTVWPTSALSLAASALLLPLGRAADLIPRNGLRLVFLWGLVLFSAASLAASLAPTFVPFVVARAFQGCGAAAFLPTGIALLGLHYRPGPRKNKVFAAYGATAPVGFWSGLAVGGWAGERALADAAREAKGISVTHTGYADWLAEGWRIYFYLGTAASIVSTVVAFLTVPTDAVSSDAVSGVGAEDGGQADDDAGSSSSGDNTVKKGKMDWLGTGTLVPALLLLVYGVTDGPNAPAGWRTWYIALALSAGVVLLVLGVYVEGWVAEQPLIPFDVFRVRHMTSLILGLFLIYGVFGIYLFYANFYIELVLGIGPLLTSMWFAPWAVGGLVLACTSGFFLHLIPGRVLLVFCAVCKVVACVLFATMPERPSYWAWVLPAMIAETACVDVVWTVTNVFVTTNLPSHRQGLAGALINCSLFLGICFFLGIANIAVEATAHLGPRQSYKTAFWVGAAFAGVALVLFAFIDIGSAKSDFTRDEKSRLECISGDSQEEIMGNTDTKLSV